MITYFKKVFIIFAYFFLMLNIFSANASKWKKDENAKCILKSNHPEIIAGDYTCSSWKTNYQIIQNIYIQNKSLSIFISLQLAQPGYYWHNSGDIFKGLKNRKFINENIRFKKSNSPAVLSSNFWTKKPDHFDVIITNKNMTI